MNFIPPDDSAFAKIITCTVEGIVEEEDLHALLQPASDDAGAAHAPVLPIPEEDPGNITRIREKHHSVARLMSSGLTQRMVAGLTGYTEGYLSVLLNSPAMQELIAHYRMRQGNAAEVVVEKLKNVGLLALEKLSDRLTGDKIDDPHALASIAKMGLDRAGHGPTSTTHTVSEAHLIDHARIAELNASAREGSRELIVPVATVREALRPQLPAPAPVDLPHADD